MDEKVYSVLEINEVIKGFLEGKQELKNITLKGEISNFNKNISGHYYFSLKDENSQIKAVMFRSNAIKVKYDISNGMKVVVTGDINLYTVNGTYQIVCRTIEPEGVGSLYVQLELLKKKLLTEGLFSESHKKPIPQYPETIGVITSSTGAAIRDIINVTRRRYPIAKIILFPATVQGDGAEESLIKALDYFEETGAADVVIIGRGGGSIEDLWCFNSEKLARKIYNANTPIISAVGHDINDTICDHVADLKVPTPSAAAEKACKDKNEILQKLDDLSNKITKDLKKKLENYSDKIDLYSKVISPKGFEDFVNNKIKDLNMMRLRLDTSIKNLIDLYTNKIEKYESSLIALNPESVLTRGYSMVLKEGKIIKNIEDLSENDKINIKLSNGEAITEVKEIKNKK